MRRLSGLLGPSLLGIGLLGLLFFSAVREARPPQTALFELDLRLGWRPKANLRVVTHGASRFLVISDARGFREPSYHPEAPGAPKAVFFGDSFVWGYDVDNHELFTEKLAQALPRWRIHNRGVSAFGPEQSYLLMQDELPRLQPDVVIFTLCVENDLEDLQSSHHGTHRKPFFVSSPGAWQLVLPTQTAPLPQPSDKGWNALRHTLGAMRDLAAEAGAHFVVTATLPSQQLESLLAHEQIVYAPLPPIDRFRTHGYHWTGLGHSQVATAWAKWFRENPELAVRKQASAAQF